MFRKILIANRGEIAIRIIRTCRKLGIQTVAVYSEPDLQSQHVVYADEAYNIGAGQPSESYLNIPKIVKVAKASKAEAAFGPSELYHEKHLKKPRHIEVQVIAGRKGQLVHLGERECSLQRRHQKILEETPAPRLDSTARKKLFSLALKIVKATKYENAGTVEFVQSAGGEFYYLETNKRIQVEHLITEMVTGVDIVEQQIRIADGEGLGFSQEEIEFSGAAMNCRINAEDPSKIGRAHV